MTKPDLEVVVVDDSPTQRRFLRAAVEAEPGFTVSGEARNGRDAVALVARLRPAVVLMDLDLPVMSGIEAIELIMAATPTPILVYSAFAGGPGSADALEALAAGAVDVLAKPGPDDTGSLASYAAAVRGRLRMVSRIRVITHPRGRLRTQGLHPQERVGTALGAGRSPAAVTTTTSTTASTPASTPTSTTARAAAPAAGAWLLPAGPGPTAACPPGSARVEARTDARLLAIGASTGGPQALLTLLRDLPADLSQAVLVVQHMAPGFIPGLVSWLDDLIDLPVVVGGGGQRLAPGTVTIAPGGGNLLVQDDRLRTLETAPDAGQFHVPGIDASFSSIAESLGPDAVGVLLTGMGRDGAVGLKAMRDRGAPTLGQDEGTSAVYGMPAAAHALGAVERQLPIEQMAAAVLGLLGRAP